MPNCPIVRVGASVAARKFKRGQGEEAYPDMLFAITNRAGGVRELGTLGFNARVAASDPKKWIGEATRWRTQERTIAPGGGHQPLVSGNARCGGNGDASGAVGAGGAGSVGGCAGVFGVSMVWKPASQAALGDSYSQKPEWARLSKNHAWRVALDKPLHPCTTACKNAESLPWN